MGIGGVEYAGDPLMCKICIGSTFETAHSVKPMPIPGKTNLLILGRDFLENFKTTEFDWANQKVRIGSEWIFMASSDSDQDIVNIIQKCKLGMDLTADQSERVRSLLKEFCQVFVKNSKSPKLCTTEVHRILSRDDRICKDKVRRLPDKWRSEVDKQVEEMLHNGIIRPSKSPYNSNPLLVSKQDKSKRFVIDFRNLNKNTIPDTYPLPDVNEMIDACLNCNYFTQLDLASGYWCLEVHEDDREKTSFSVPNGKYEFVRMPFGLRNSQSTFQRVTDKVITDLRRRGIESVAGYVDNFFIFSETFDEHLSTLTAVLEEIAKHNLSLKAEKCELGVKEVDFLGFHIKKNEIMPRKDNIQKLMNFPTPTSKKQLQRLLGIANFNRRFVPKYAEITKPLTELLTEGVSFVWSEDQETAFSKLKHVLSNPPALGMPDFSKDFYIQTDASDVAVGGVLFQKEESGIPLVLGYHSKTLKKSQRNWSVTEKEMFAIKECAQKWDVYCKGKVTFLTDHEPLKCIRKHKDNRGKIVRWLLELESIDYSIEYIKGPDNEIADAFSRVVINDNEVPANEFQDEDINIFTADNGTGYCDMDKIKQYQKEDGVIKFVRNRLLAGKKVNKGPFRNTKFLRMENDVLKKGERIVIPEKLQKELTDEIHGQYHLGVENTTMMIQSRFWWRKMSSQIEQWVKNCQSCAMCKRQTQPKAKLTLTPENTEPRKAISIDIASMPMSNRGNICFLVIVDNATRFTATAVMENQKAETIKYALWDKWFSVFGVPESIRSDQGSNVDGNVINEMCEQLKITKLRSSPYHPQGNGLAERTIASVKSLVSVMCQSRKISIHGWDLVIGEAVLAHNNAVNKSLKFSPFLCMFSDQAHLPLDNFIGLKDKRTEQLLGTAVRKNAEMNLQEAKVRYKEQHDKKAVQHQYNVGEEVLLKRNFGPYPKISVNWKKGPYVVVKRIGPVNYAIKNPQGMIKVLHHDNIMPVCEEHEASKTVAYDKPTNTPLETTPVTPLQTFQADNLVTEQQLNRQIGQIDRTAFTRAVLNTPRDNMTPLQQLQGNNSQDYQRVSGRQRNQTQFYGVDSQMQSDYFGSDNEF